jgi:chromosome segregation ATPase
MLTQLRASLASVSSELQSTRADLEQRTSDLVDKTKQKDKQIADLVAQLDDLQVQQHQQQQQQQQRSQEEAVLRSQEEEMKTSTDQAVNDKLTLANSEKDRLQRHLLELEADQEDQFAHYEEQIKTLNEALTSAHVHEDELVDLRRENTELREDSYKAKAAVDSKVYEIMNLQSALGQLTADSELCGQYRSEIQRLGVKNEAMEKEISAMKDHQRDQQSGEETLREELEAATRSKDEVFQEGIRFKQENLKLRQALHECLERIKAGNSDQDNQIDRRIVYKLLSTYFEKGFEAEVMKVMGGILGFTEEEQHKLQQLASGARKNVLGTVANVPISIVKAPLSLAGNAINKVQVPETDSSLGEAWIQFLTESTEAPDPMSPIKQ